MVLQKKSALPSPKRLIEGTKLNLQALAIAIVMALRLRVDRTDLDTIALTQSQGDLISDLLLWVRTRRVFAGPDHGCCE